MIKHIEQLILKVDQAILDNKKALEAFHQNFMGKQGILPNLFKQFQQCPKTEKKAIGIALNALKQKVQNKLKQSTIQLKAKDPLVKKTNSDVTLPGFGPEQGSQHPLTLLQHNIITLFHNLGFNLVDGPEIVHDWDNFQALNFAPNHPARAMQDTFFIQKDWLLRTHTTSIQVKALTNTQLPIRSIAIGRVYRNETVSARSNCFFHQIDGFYIDHQVTFQDLKAILYAFIHQLFGTDTKIRFRGSYFPFTEPSVEVDIHCPLCKNGCNVCKNTNWVEILGAGMIDPNVLQNCKINSQNYTGLAFGLGLERLAMLWYQIDDLRLFFENHIGFLRQFCATR